MATFQQYSDRYEHVRMTRKDGVLEVVLHTNGGSLVWGAGPHRELPRAFGEIGSDRENRIVIITGAGQDFCANRDESLARARRSAEDWDVVYWEGKQLLQNLLGIEVPVIAAVNGPARYHAEIAALADIVIAADTALFQDKPHFMSGVVPGDGVQFIWPMLLGPNRGRYFLLTGQEISAEEAKTLGVVSEVMAPAELMIRARELAHTLAQNRTLTLRYTRVALIHQLRQIVASDLGYGLSLEGMALLPTPESH